MTKSFNKVANDVQYKIDVWVRYDSTHELFKLGVQAVPRKGKIFSFSGRLSKEFVEDELDSHKKVDYLENLLEKVVEKHFDDILGRQPDTGLKNIQWWFSDAKRELENEKEE